MRRTKNRLIQYQLSTFCSSASKHFSRSELIVLLAKRHINPVGSLTAGSKKDLLRRTLKEADENVLKKFISLANKNMSKAQIGSHSVGRFDLHEDFIGTKVEKYIRSGDYEEAVRVACLRINNRIKKISGLDLDGASLMRRVFSRNNPYIPVNSLSSQEDSDEQEGIMHLFEGCILAFRNPPSHDDERTKSKAESRRIISLASYLMSILDRFESN